MTFAGRLRCLGAVAGVLAAAGATAQVIPITNAGFEANAIADGTFQVLVPTGWQVYDPSSIVNQATNAVGVIRPVLGQDFFPGGAAQGAQAALVYLDGAASGPAGLQQTLAATLAVNMRYTFRAAIGNIDSGRSLPGSADGGNVNYNLKGFPGYRIELLAGTTVLGSDTSSAGVIPEGEWRTATLQIDSSSFGALVGQALTVRLINLDAAGTALAPAIEVDFDAVSLVASPVPEPGPAAMWLSGLALAALLVARRKRGTHPFSSKKGCVPFSSA